MSNNTISFHTDHRDAATMQCQSDLDTEILPPPQRNPPMGGIRGMEGMDMGGGG